MGHREDKMSLAAKEKLDKIHAASIKILNETGMKLHSPEAVALFAKAGQRTEGDRVFLTEEFIWSQLKQAPAKFVLEARNPEYNMTLGGNNRHYAAGYGCPAIYEADGSLRDATINDYIKFAKIIHQSPAFKINGGILAQPGEVAPDLASLAMVYAAMIHSDKCLFIVPETREKYLKIMDLCAALWGGKEKFTSAPHTMTMISTLSPLQMDKMALDSIMLCAGHGQAMMISPGPMAGATGPVTLAGNIALGNAECLVGLTLAQLVKPGTAVMYGLQATTSDLRTGAIAIGTPGYALQAKYCKSLASYYNLPCRCGGGVNDAKEVSAQSGYEAVLPIFTTAQNGVDMIVHATGILDSWAAISYEKFMCDLDIISMVEYFLSDIEVDDDSLAVDLIQQVGPGGIFLNQKHTRLRARTAPWYPKVAQRGPLGGGRVAEALIKNAQNEIDRLLSDYQAPFISPEIFAAVDKVMTDAGAKQSWLDSVKPKAQA
ncbi:trimethylamine methyltransferase family protein [Deltaproteobacteria bacterium OttesenSCG-928-K17]|nr:trimethylamine methyltransferase family protein [Deltaproteobacteria bacterium OttesenSCG-928-K17]